MNDDDLEQRLAGLPLREPPSVWRQQILDAARVSRKADCLPRETPARILALALVHRLIRQFVRIPAPWTALACAWGLAMVLHQLSSHDFNRRIPASASEVASRPGSGLLAAAQAYRAEVLSMVEWEDLTGETKAPSADLKPNQPSRPRTQVTPRYDPDRRPSGNHAADQFGRDRRFTTEEGPPVHAACGARRGLDWASAWRGVASNQRGVWDHPTHRSWET